MKKYEKDFYKWLEKNEVVYTEFLQIQMDALYQEFLIEKEYSKRSE